MFDLLTLFPNKMNRVILIPFRVVPYIPNKGGKKNKNETWNVCHYTNNFVQTKDQKKYFFFLKKKISKSVFI